MAAERAGPRAPTRNPDLGGVAGDGFRPSKRRPWEALTLQGRRPRTLPFNPTEDGGLKGPKTPLGIRLVRIGAAILQIWPTAPGLSQIRLGQVQLAAEGKSQLRCSARPGT